MKTSGFLIVSDNKSNRAEFIRIPPDAPIMEVKQFLNRQLCNEVRLIASDLSHCSFYELATITGYIGDGWRKRL
jgi:hypothetical protein